MDPEVATHRQPEPSGVSLKAAYLLLREMNQSPEPPTIESLAAMLDRTLNYSEAVALIRDAREVVGDCSSCEFMHKPLTDFEDWARANLG
jgi:hypothetical protein